LALYPKIAENYIIASSYVKATEAIIEIIPEAMSSLIVWIEMIQPQYPSPSIPTVIKNSQQI